MVSWFRGYFYFVGSWLVVLSVLPLVSVAALSSAEQNATATTSLTAILNRPVPLRDGIGGANETVTASSTRAQAFYNQGLSYLHSFVWIEAARSFNEALRVDPRLAMADLGLSYALGELGLSAEARAAARNAEALAARASERERMRIAVRVSQLEASARPGDAPLRSAYRERLDQLIAKYPDDIEILLLAGQAQDSTDGGHGMGAGSASLSFYERALARAPGYFAVHHYLTHAYENLGRTNDALVHAERYAKSADAIPHAHHMYGHVLRRVDRIADAVEQFETADRLAQTFLQSEGIPPAYDWHYRHNLNLLGTAYQYRGQMKAADPVLRRSFELESIDRSTQDLNRKDLPVFLLAANRPADALTAAQTMSKSANPLTAALGRIFASRALAARGDPNAARDEGNTALRQMRDIGATGGMLVPEYQFAQAEFLLKNGQRDEGRSIMRQALDKLRDQSGPDAWMQTLFSLESAARTARDSGDWSLAAEISAQLIQYDPSYAGSHYARALSAEHGGDRATARSAFGETIKRWSAADRDFPPLQDVARRLASLPR